MTIHLDHIMVPSRDKVASAKLLAELLGVPWSETDVGPFAPVFVNDALTLDFDEWSVRGLGLPRRLRYDVARSDFSVGQMCTTSMSKPILEQEEGHWPSPVAA